MGRVQGVVATTDRAEANVIRTRVGRSFVGGHRRPAGRADTPGRQKRPRNGQMKEAALGGGRQVGSKRTSRSRLWANTAECTYAWKCSQPRQ